MKIIKAVYSIRIMISKKKIWVLLCILISSQFYAQETSIVKTALGEKLEREFSPYLIQFSKVNDLPGVVVGVTKNGQLIYAKALGYRNVDTGRKMELNSVFHMASISKLFVATAILQLVEQGELDLDDPIVKHLPYFKLNDDRYRRITIAHVLSHVSGLPDVEDYEWENPQYSDAAAENYVKSISGLKLNADPGETFAYSNLAFDILGDLIAKTSGMSFEEYQNKFVFEPLGMHNSTFLKDDSIPATWAYPHIRYTHNKLAKVYPYNRKHAPSSTLHSNLVDMTRWAVASINKGALDEERVLEKASYDLMWEQKQTLRKNRHVGLSWFMSDFEGYKKYGHSGSDIGFTTNFDIIPEKRLGIIVFSNTSGVDVKAITNRAFETIFGLEHQTYKKNAFLQITETFNSQGLEKAIDQWHELKENHAEEYDFEPNTALCLFDAMQWNEVEEARKLSLLVKSIFPAEVHEVVVSIAENHIRESSADDAAIAIVEIFKKD
ncbi:MAG: hypothetical protein Tsb004_29720 [Allomuricauda sp.]